MLHVAARFERGEPPPTVRELSETLSLPGPVVDRLIGLLAEVGLVRGTGHDPLGYLPARPPARIPVHEVLEAVRGAGERVALVSGTQGGAGPVEEVMRAWCAGARQAVSGLTLGDLAGRLEGAPVVARIGAASERQEEVCADG